MQTHGDHDLHPGEDADGLGGGESLGEEMVGGGHFLGHPLGGGDVQPRLDGKEDRGQAVCLIDVIRGGGQVLDAGLEAGPGAQDEADVLPVGGDAAAVQDAVDDLRRCGGEAHGGVGREGDGGLGHAQDLQLFPGVGVPQGDGIDVFVHHLGGAAAVAVLLDGADAAAVHDDGAVVLFRRCQGPEVEPQGAVGRHVLHEGPAAVDEELRLAEVADGLEAIEGIEGVDPVGPPGIHGAAGEDLEGQVRVDGAQFGEDGQQNGVIPGVTAAVGPTDHHPVPALSLVAENGLVDFQLALDGGLDGELPLGLFIEPLAHGLAQAGVLGQGDEMPSQSVRIPRREEEAVGAVVDEVGHAADLTAHGGQPGACPFGQGVGEGLGDGGQGVDVQGIVEGIGVVDPPGKADLVGNAQIGGQLLEVGHLLPVARDEQAQLGRGLVGLGKAADQGRDVLDGVQPGGDAGDDAVCVRLQPDGAEIVFPAHGGGAGGEVQAVVNGKELFRVELPLDEQVDHGVGDADAIVQLPQGQGIDGPVGQAGEGTAQIVQPIVAVDGGHGGQAGLFGQEGRHHVAAGAVAVDEVKVLVPDHLGQLLQVGEKVSTGEDLGVDAQGAGLLDKGAFGETDHFYLNAGGQTSQEGMDVGLCPARIAAADQMEYFHGFSSENRLMG